MKKITDREYWWEPLFKVAGIFYFLGLPILFLFALGASDMYRRNSVTADGLYALFFWVALIIPTTLAIRRIITTHRKLKDIVKIVKSNTDFTIKDVLHDSFYTRQGIYFGTDMAKGLHLYIKVHRTGLIDVLGFNAYDFAQSSFQGKTIKLYTKLGSVPVIEIGSHFPDVIVDRVYQQSQRGYSYSHDFQKEVAALTPAIEKATGGKVAEIY